MIGHCTLNRHLAKVGSRQSPVCENCQMTDDQHSTNSVIYISRSNESKNIRVWYNHPAEFAISKDRVNIVIPT